MSRIDSSRPHREIHSAHVDNAVRSPAGYLVCERNSVVPNPNPGRYEPGSTKRLCYLGGPREERREDFLWTGEREFMTLSIQRLDDFVEAHEITDEGQVLAIADLIRTCERSGNDVAELADIAHVNATHIGIERKAQPRDPLACFCGASVPTRFW